VKIVIYDADIKEEGVEKLNRIFSESPYELNCTGGRQQVSLNWEGRKVSLLAYSKDDICIFHGAVVSIPSEARTNLEAKFEELECLEKVVKKLKRTK